MGESMEKTQADRRDGGNYDLLREIDVLDEKYLEMVGLLRNQGDLSDDDLRERINSLYHGLIELDESVRRRGDIAEYYDHDVGAWFRYASAMLYPTYCSIEDLREKVNNLAEDWEVCRLVMQDVAIRCADGESRISQESMLLDRDSDLHRMLKACDFIMQGYHNQKHGLYISEITVDEKLKNSRYRIDIPHGTIVNLISNFLRNASHFSVLGKFKRGANGRGSDVGYLKLDIRADGGELVFSFYDNGCGMSAEKMSRIFGKGYTDGKEGIGKGLGLAFADARVASAGGRLLLASREKRRNGEKTNYGRTNYFPEEISERKSIGLDDGLNKFSTCFQIRVPIVETNNK